MQDELPLCIVHTSPERAELVCAWLFWLGALSLEQRDHETLLAPDARGVTLLAAFETTTEAEQACEWLRTQNEECTTEPMVCEQWIAAASIPLRPIALGKRLLLTGAWEENAPEEFVQIRLATSRAFGSGLHPTTALAAAALERIYEEATLQQNLIIDVGCGTGVLFLIALALGASSAIACDIDPVALEASARNVALLPEKKPVELLLGGASSVRATAPLVVANIYSSVLLPDAQAIASLVAPGGMLVLTGFVLEELSLIEQTYAAHALESVWADRSFDWCVAVFAKRAVTAC